MRIFRAVSLIGTGGLCLALANADGPPPAHTGGFGEPTCLACHFDGALNEPGGGLTVQGLPAHYTPGRVYALALTVARPRMRQGGFQLSARFAEGPAAGRQAGAFAVSGTGVAMDVQEGIAYVRHTRPEASDVPDSARWTFDWKAPEAAAGPVVFHAAANAADGDASPFGDFIYAREIVLPGPQARPGEHP